METIMTLGSHFLISWLSSVNFLKERRERTVITVAGISPDLDALGGIIDSITGTTNYYQQFHHYFGHCGLFGIFVAFLAFTLARNQKKMTVFLSLAVFHLHLICDLIGSKGPDGYQWPIYYFYPFNTDVGFIWSRQWELNAWQNQLILASLLYTCFVYAKTKRVTFIEVISPRLQTALYKMVDKYSTKRV